MGWAEAEMRCNKHPKHKQSLGVCSYCLRERLTKLSSSANNNNNSKVMEGWSCSSSLSSSPYSSGATSSYSSPLHDRFASSEGRGPRLFLKSRSMLGFAPRMRSTRGRSAVEATDGKKKLGFWSKLFRSTGKKTKKMLLHSRTMR